MSSAAPSHPTQRPPYAYHCVDKSVLTPAFRRWWVPAFMDWIPAWVPPNYITLFSSACMWAALALVGWRHALSPWTLGLGLAALIHLYLVYDQVDGMHAKKTRTSSALGEFLDHYLDTYHGAIMVLALFALFDFARPAFALAMLGCSHLAFAATMLEERERKELVFGAFSAVEAVAIFTAFFCSWLSPGARAWWAAPLVAGWPAYACLALVGGVGSVVAAGECLWRVGRVPAEFAVFAIGGAGLVAWTGAAPLSFGVAAAVVILFCGDYTGRIIGSHLLGRRAPWPDLVTLALLGVAAVAGGDRAGMFGFGLLGWLAVRSGSTTLTILWALRDDWRWSNPSPAAVESGRGGEM